MNYFGLFFTFMVPGIVLGLLAAYSLREAAAAKRRKGARARQRAARQAERHKRALYVSTLAAREESRAA